MDVLRVRGSREGGGGGGSLGGPAFLRGTLIGLPGAGGEVWRCEPKALDEAAQYEQSRSPHVERYIHITYQSTVDT